MPILKVSALALLVMTVAGCEPQGAPVGKERTAEDATRFFTRGSRIGLSPDAGLYKWSPTMAEWHHVATIHSMSDDRPNGTTSRGSTA
jgi:hypothetical protein